jgi:hypothetical protein
MNLIEHMRNWNYETGHDFFKYLKYQIVINYGTRNKRYDDTFVEVRYK